MRCLSETVFRLANYAVELGTLKSAVRLSTRRSGTSAYLFKGLGGSIAVISCGIAFQGCLGSGKMADGTIGVPADRVYAKEFLNPESGRGQLVFLRDRGMRLVSVPAKISLDDKLVADVNVGEQLVVYVSPGEHSLTCEGFVSFAAPDQKGASKGKVIMAVRVFGEPKTLKVTATSTSSETFRIAPPPPDAPNSDGFSLKSLAPPN